MRKPDHVEVYRDTDDMWRWRYVAGNGRVLADSAEGYRRRIDCQKALAVVIGRDKAEEWQRWRDGWRLPV